MSFRHVNGMFPSGYFYKKVKKFIGYQFVCPACNAKMWIYTYKGVDLVILYLKSNQNLFSLYVSREHFSAPLRPRN